MSFLTAIGLMSGTSLDGVDVAYYLVHSMESGVNGGGAVSAV